MIIAEYEGIIPGEVMNEIVALAKTCNIGEQFDEGCDLIYCWLKDGKIVGCIAFKRVLFSNGSVLPRFEHIFGIEAVRKTSAGPRFLIEVQHRIAAKGFKQFWAYVSHERIEMLNYALKFNLVEYARDDKGVYLAKNI
jgi:hypothetical protein